MTLPLVWLPEGWMPDGATLGGRVVLVTGSSGGLGSAVVRAVARAGATVVLAGRRQRQLEQIYDAMRAEGLPEPVIHLLDLETAMPDDYAVLADALERDMGRLDGLVHAAASFPGLTPLAVHKPDAWLRTLHVNVSAPFALTQACLPLLAQASDSAVVCVLDDPALTSRAHWGSYGVSKAALEGYVDILHQETERGPVRACALRPGPMRTALRWEAYSGEDTRVHPMPTAAADAVVYLLSGQGAAARGAVLDLRPMA